MTDGRPPSIINNNPTLHTKVRAGSSLLIVGPSGSGKTSILRALAGLWDAGSGAILSYGLPSLGDPGCEPGGVLFLPQKPYMILGSLRDQLLYPTWSERDPAPAEGQGGDGSGGGGGAGSSAAAARPAAPPPPDDAALEAVLRRVQLGSLLDRCRLTVQVAAPAAGGSGGGEAAGSDTAGGSSSGSTSGGGSGSGSGISPGRGSSSPLDCTADWASLLSLGEQQRLAFARLLLAKPRLALLDESTSACDTTSEALLYRAVLEAGVALVSVGHRPTLVKFHDRVLSLGAGAPGGGGGGEGGAPWQLVGAAEFEASLAEAAAAAAAPGGGR